tara:strand:- start:308 stop:454 length:147 start_codon:yes stop_codon:yes gene_type:complete
MMERFKNVASVSRMYIMSLEEDVTERPEWAWLTEDVLENYVAGMESKL